MAVARTAGHWLSAHDPDFTALRKSLRVTVAACIGFFLCEYALGQSVLATYAVFGAISLGALSDVSGPPAQRTRTFAAALPVGLVLVMVGTAAARSTTAAVLGMLVVGFAVAYAGVGGPRLNGVANGLQLFYVLPCFPPYDPAALPQRLAGLTIGIVLVAATDRLLWPAAGPAPFPRQLAAATTAVGRYVRALRIDPNGPREAAEAAVAALRPSGVPAAARPTGPGRRDRGLTHATLELRTTLVRGGTLEGLLPDIAVPATLDAVADLLTTAADTFDHCAAALTGDGPPPKSGPVVAAIERFVDGRADRIARLLTSDELPPVLRTGGLAAAIGDAARETVAATRAAIGAPMDPTAAPPASAWYLTLPTPELWWRRFRAHLTPRSVYFQNALRLALGLAAARLAADLLDLSHGFWVLLATLSLMRTSLVASGLALVPAFLGTFGGAVVAAGVLTLTGDHVVVYVVVLPLAMLVTFAAGPLLGPAAAQFGFAVVVSVLFAQMAPTTWKLAEVRLEDVVVGGLVGALIGAAVWPRGGSGEVRRSAAACLRLIADDLVMTVRCVTGEPQPAATRPRQSDANVLTALFDHTYAQFRSEPGTAKEPGDWLPVLSVVRRATGDADELRERYPEPDPLPWPAVCRTLVAAAEEVADAYRATAGDLLARAPARSDRHLLQRLDAHPPRAPFRDDPHATLRVVDAWGWLHGLARDLDQAEGAVAIRSR